MSMIYDVFYESKGVRSMDKRVLWPWDRPDRDAQYASNINRDGHLLLPVDGRWIEVPCPVNVSLAKLRAEGNPSVIKALYRAGIKP